MTLSGSEVDLPAVGSTLKEVRRDGRGRARTAFQDPPARRLKLGLCEAMTCNRFSVWGIAGSLWVILEAIVTVNDFEPTFRWFAHKCGALPGGGSSRFRGIPI